MFSCKDMVRLTSEEQDKKLSFLGKLNYKMHLMMCDKCRNFIKNMTALNESLKSLIKKKSEEVDPKKIKKLEDEIKEKFKS